MMRILTERLILEPLALTHVDVIHDLNSFPEVAYYNTIGIPKERSETADLVGKVIENQQTLGWVAHTNNSLQFAGQVGLSLAPKRFKSGEIHYNLHPKFWGQGFATEMVTAIIDYCFTTLDLHRIQAGVATENRKSIALLERIGMTREGRSRKILPLASGWADNFTYSLLREEV